MQSVRIKVCAKINLSLLVDGKTGLYHKLDTVMTSVNISDAVTVCPRRDGEINVRFSSGISGAGTNAERAAKLMRDNFGLTGADIFIAQGIPSCGGLGGSSADAAGVIRALDIAYGLDLTVDELRSVAVKIGSDVPYMLYGGYARLIGTGSELTHFSGPEGTVLLAGKGEVNTARCFDKFDSVSAQKTEGDNDALVKTLQSGEFFAARKYFINELTGAAILLNPYIDEIQCIMKDAGLTACMTGSGAFVFGAGSFDRITVASERLGKKGYDYNLIKIVQNGCEIV